GGTTSTVIRGTLEELGYAVTEQVIDARAWVPQHRERVFIVGLRRDAYGGKAFAFPELPAYEDGPTLGSALEPFGVDRKYWLSAHLWKYLRDYAKKHAEKGNGFGFSVFGEDDVTRTL